MPAPIIVESILRPKEAAAPECRFITTNPESDCLSTDITGSWDWCYILVRMIKRVTLLLKMRAYDKT
jgi:hypothetical protein